ncbi:MAG: V-type ATP synthase subunit E family protein [Candidatus Diapherotrites archaeon]|nr:V-type ATP synthase subunit E family protein [Candidatus Diapherotrites archaeon]
MQPIIEKIRADAQRKAKALEQACEKEAGTIKDQALKEAKRLAAEIISLAEKEAAIEEKRSVSRALLSTKKERMALLDKKLSEIINDVRDNLAELRKEKTYEQKLSKMLLEAIDQMPDEEITVECQPEDFDMVSKALMDKQVKIVKTKSLGPGAIVKNKTGSIIIDCTFSALLDEKIHEIKKAMVKELGE